MSVWSLLVGLATGAVFGAYVAQNYKVPNVTQLFSRASNMVASYEKDGNQGGGGGSQPPQQQRQEQSSQDSGEKK